MASLEYQNHIIRKIILDLKPSFASLVLAALTALSLYTTPIAASEEHDHSNDAPLAVQLSNLDDAVNAVAFFQREVDSHITSGALLQVHASAFAARDTATSASDFANALTETNRRELAQTVQRIAAVAVQLDKYGDAGKPQETQMFAIRLRDEVVALQRITGVEIRPDWRPVFLAPPNGHAASKCPHKANHGGRFSLALNDEYHIEGSYPEAGLFRLHFYDKESCPIPSAPFSGRLLFQEAQQSIELSASPDGTHLFGQLPTTLPVSVTAIVRLPHPQTGVVSTEHFSYNFHKLSKKPVGPDTTGTLLMDSSTSSSKGTH